MHAFAQMKGIERHDDLDLYLVVIPLLDDEWIADHYQKKEAGKSKK